MVEKGYRGQLVEMLDALPSGRFTDEDVMSWMSVDRDTAISTVNSLRQRDEYRQAIEVIVRGKVWHYAGFDKVLEYKHAKNPRPVIDTRDPVKPEPKRPRLSDRITVEVIDHFLNGGLLVRWDGELYRLHKL
jgi:hypothetical protein